MSIEESLASIPSLAGGVEVNMANPPMADTQVKMLFKQAVTEALQERQDWLYDLFVEALEDFAFARAMQEGESDERVSREEVFRYLDSVV